MLYMSTRKLVARLLGPPSLHWQGERAKARSQKALALLYYVAARGEAGRAELAELLWGVGRYHNVRQALFSLRQLPGAECWLEDGDPIRLRAWCDVATFEAAMSEGAYTDALALCRGELLAGFEPKGTPAFSDWLEVERSRLAALHLDALRHHAASLEHRGEAAAALEHLHELLKLDPLDESAHRAVMRLEYARGHIQAALAQFGRCRRALLEELGAEPLAETQALADLIAQGQGVIPDTVQPSKRVPPQLLRPPILIGREAAWAKMEAAWDAGQTLLITGPAGVGKTRLMMDFVESKGSYLLLEGRPGDAHVPYSVARRSLGVIFEAFPDLDLPGWVKRELARLTPHLFPGLTVAPAQSEFSAMPQFHEAYLELMQRVRYAVTALPADDVHYYDRASEEVSGRLMPAFARGPNPDAARMVIAYREAELNPFHREVLERGVAAGQAALIRLEPLDTEATGSLITSLELGADPELAERLYRYAGGNPVLIIETLKDLYLRDELGTSASFALPERASLFLKRRLDTLDADTLRLLHAAAVTQPTTSAELLGEMVGQSPLDVAERLGELERLGIMSGYSFVYDLALEAVLAHTPEAVLRALHREAARALKRLSLDSARTAHHWSEAGEPGLAVTHWLEAANRYRETGLLSAAAETLEHVIAHSDAPSVTQRAQIELARTYAELGQFKRAQRALEPLTRTVLSPSLRARTRGVRALIELGGGRLREAEEAAASGVRLAVDAADKAVEQNLRLLQARILHRTERHHEALGILQPLLESLRQKPPSPIFIAVLSEVAALYDNLGNATEALPLHYEAFEHAYALGSQPQQVTVTNHLVYCLLSLGRPEDALDPAEAALELGHYRDSDLLRINLARAYLELGRFEDAAEHYHHLSEHTSDKALEAAAWARLSEVYARTDATAEVEGMLGRAISLLETTDFSRAHARVVIAALRYGDEAQRAKVQPYLAKLRIDNLPPYLKDELNTLTDEL